MVPLATDIGNFKIYLGVNTEAKDSKRWHYLFIVPRLVSPASSNIDHVIGCQLPKYGTGWVPVDVMDPDTGHRF